jgi:hypothetical protein
MPGVRQRTNKLHVMKNIAVWSSGRHVTRLFIWLACNPEDIEFFIED